MSKKEDIFISRETIQRLLKDIKNIIINPLESHGIYYKHDETDILKGYALIFGPEDSLYKHGAYLFEITYPDNYPHSPPKVKFHTNDGITRFHPNLYKSGKVCLSILNTWKGDQWTACLNINTILLTLISILDNKPLLHEPGINERHIDFNNYNKIIKYKNIEVAILQILNKKILPKTFECFYEVIKKNYILHHEDISKIIKENKSLNSETIILQIYNGRPGYKFVLDYAKLEKQNLLEYTNFKLLN